MPQLLVSVRSVAEARAAIAGGCDLLDVKEPRRGSLGAADPATIAAICEDVGTSERRPPISVALGELMDWADETSVPSLPSSVELVKLGLSRCESLLDWPVRWQGLRERFDAAAGRPLGWIAVHYADAVALSPGFDRLLAAAVSTGCRGLLVDTFTKAGRRLFDHATSQHLETCRRSTASAGLLFALAGSLNRDDLPRLKEVDPDIIAIRSAACRSSDRTATVDEAAVRSFRKAIDAAWQTSRRESLPRSGISGDEPTG